MIAGDSGWIVQRYTVCAAQQRIFTCCHPELGVHHCVDFTTAKTVVAGIVKSNVRVRRATNAMSGAINDRVGNRCLEERKRSLHVIERVHEVLLWQNGTRHLERAKRFLTANSPGSRSQVHAMVIRRLASLTMN